MVVFKGENPAYQSFSKEKCLLGVFKKEGSMPLLRSDGNKVEAEKCLATQEYSLEAQNSKKHLFLLFFFFF